MFAKIRRNTSQIFAGFLPMWTMGRFLQGSQPFSFCRCSVFWSLHENVKQSVTLIGLLIRMVSVGHAFYDFWFSGFFIAFPSKNKETPCKYNENGKTAVIFFILFFLELFLCGYRLVWSRSKAGWLSRLRPDPEANWLGQLWVLTTDWQAPSALEAGQRPGLKSFGRRYLWVHVLK